MSKLLKQTLAVALGSVTFGGVGVGVAVADEGTEERTGISVVAGGGIEDWFDNTMRDTSNTNGTWAVHGALEVQKYFTLEAGYIGSASMVNAPIGNTSATLVGTTVEALARVSPMPDAVLSPYAFVGAAWRRYDVSGESFTTSDSGMSDSDDLFQVPFGAGLGYRTSGFLVDARLSFRPSIDGELVVDDPQDDSYRSLMTWGLSGGVGYEF